MDSTGVVDHIQVSWKMPGQIIRSLCQNDKFCQLRFRTGLWFQVTHEVYNILEPRGYRLKCRGKINVKGKGSMITYFLQKKLNGNDDENESELLTHQTSKVTATSSIEMFGGDCGIDDVIESSSDNARLTQKRKSLCRQHNIFSSLTNKSITSHTPDQSFGGSFDMGDDSSILINERTRLMHDSDTHTSNDTIISADTHMARNLKCEFKPNLPHFSVNLKDSIESLEKLLKNDCSLADLGSSKASKGVAEGNDSSGKGSLCARSCAGNQNISIKRTRENVVMGATTANGSTKKTIKSAIGFGSRSPMKLSKSLYPFAKEQLDTIKMPNSKSMFVVSTQNQNGTISMI